MNDGRLILILDNIPNKESRQALKEFWRHLTPGDKPTFALGLLPDVTLSLSSHFPQYIYNAFEFLPLTDQTVWSALNINEVYTLLRGNIWPNKPFNQQAKQGVQFQQIGLLDASA